MSHNFFLLPLTLSNHHSKIHVLVWGDLLIVHRWAVRNSGLMLMSVLINRLNSGTDINSTTTPSSHRSNHFVYQQFPALPDIILRLLRSRKSTYAPIIGDGERVEQIFPAFEILERYGLPRGQQERISGTLKNHMKSRFWPMREKAAKTYSAIIPEQDAITAFGDLLTASCDTQNALHGKLLAARWLLRRHRTFMSNTDECKETL